MSNHDDTFFGEMRSLYETPVVKDFYHHVAAIAGFSLPPSLKGIFDTHRQHFFEEPQPSFMANYGEAANQHWQKLYMESVFGSSQSASAAVLYHRENLLRIERDLLSFIDLERLVAILGKSSFGGGNTQKLDFEYHGFVFAYRRTLDYLARGIAALLHQEFKSFRRLPNFLAGHTRHAWVRDVIDIHSYHAPRLDTFLGNRSNQSVRDRIAHYIHVPAGSLQVTVNGVFFFGGGEKVNQNRKLTDVTSDYVQTLKELLGEIFSAIAHGFPKNLA